MRIILALLLATPSLNCCRIRSTSDLKIDNGIAVLDADSAMPGVYAISFSENNRLAKTGDIICTGVAVSHNTLLTAAHCLTSKLNNRATEMHSISDRKMDVILLNGKRIQSLNALYPSVYNSARDFESLQFSHDVAVMIFPDNTFSYFHSVETKVEPSKKGQVSMVGFSPAFSSIPEKMYKRWGSAEILDFEGEQPLSSQKGSSNAPLTTNQVSQEGDHKVILSTRTVEDTVLSSVSPGDSGGPMFNKSCKVIGVASRRQEGGKQITSLHTLVSSTSTRDFLETVERQFGAVICRDDSCKDDPKLVVTSKVLDGASFPCRSLWKRGILKSRRLFWR